MKIKLILAIILMLLLSPEIYSQDKLFFNRIHYFEHQDCEHPIGTVIYDKVFFGNNADNTSFLNFNNTENELIYVDLTNFGGLTAFNQFVKTNFLGANTVMMGFKRGVPRISESIKQARASFKLDKVKDTMVGEKKLKHIRIKPKDTLAHRFQSYNILIDLEGYKFCRDVLSGFEVTNKRVIVK